MTKVYQSTSETNSNRMFRRTATVDPHTGLGAISRITRMAFRYPVRAWLALVGGDQAIREELCNRLVAQFGITTFAAKPLAEPMKVVGNAPARVRHGRRSPDLEANVDQAGVPEKLAGEMPASQGADVGSDQVGSVICVDPDQGPWVSAFMPPLPQLTSPETASVNVPRLVARMQSTTDQTRWPAPHQMWPAGWRWPEYRLEIDDLDWAVSELASALSSMRCPVEAVTADGGWW